MIREAEVYVLSERAFTGVVAHIREDQWPLPAPPGFSTGRQGRVTLREIISYHAYDTAWVPDTLAGRTIDEVGTRWDSLREDGAPRYAELAAAAIAAAEQVDDGSRTVHLSYGDWPAAEYLKHITSFRGFRAYDIARWIGAPTKLPDALVEGMWELLAPEAEQWRAMGVYREAVPVPEDAPLQDRLLGISGRDPYAPV